MPTHNPEHNETPSLTYEDWIDKQSKEDQKQIRKLYPPDDPMFKHTSDQGKIYVAKRFLPPRSLTPPRSYLLDTYNNLQAARKQLAPAVRANDTQISRHRFTETMKETNCRALDEAQQDLGALETKSIER